MITANLSPTAYVENNCITNNFGLGNKLFKIAATLGLAEKFNTAAVFPDLSHKNHKYFKETIFRNLEDNNGDKSFIKKDFLWYRSGYTDIPFSEGLNLKGDFQSWKYFSNIESKIHKTFKISKKVDNEINKSKYAYLLKNNLKTVAIHVRRGDYTNHTDQYKMVDVEYIKKARAFFDNSHIFVIFSDDIEWCKKNINFDNSDVFVENKTEIFDLYFMSMMNHNIISNSTFSWWGAYLNSNVGKITISPSEWFGPTLKKSGYYTDEDLLMKEWKQI